ncbi:MAG: Verru_Chthon cassette protein D [Verrucomicrobiales bacterium]|nr:Verru_Chthon cassette protein D [Verrucomicrobiales bacterium]
MRAMEMRSEPMKQKQPRSGALRGFSIFEMLLVMSIVALLVGMAAPALTSVLKGSKLTQAGDLIRDQFAAASEIATTESREVVVRFFKYDDDMIPGSESAFRAFQLVGRLSPSDVDQVDAGRRPEPEVLSKVFRLPDGIIVSEREAYSTILTEEELRCPSGTTVAKRGGEAGETIQAECYSFGFRADGTTSLPVGSRYRDSVWFLTLVDENQASASGDGLSTNFITLQVDPFTGNVRKFQP